MHVQILLVYDKFEKVLTLEDHDEKFHFHPSLETFDNNRNILQQFFIFQNMRNHGTNSVWWQPCTLDQLQISYHGFHDPISDWMESSLLRVTKDEGFGILSVSKSRD